MSRPPRHDAHRFAASVARWLLQPVAWAYGACVVASRAWRSRPGARRRAAVRVVSVGNLTTGGTGKGPMVRWIAERLLDFGRHPVIALRGYRAGTEGSDEALEHARLVPRAAIAVGADRAAAIARILAQRPEVDLAILDDGFQHWQLHRDLDLVLIDATRPGLDDAMLPAGRRREPCSALRRAHGVIVTRAERVDSELAAKIEAMHGRAPLAWCRHSWRSLEIFDAGSCGTAHRVEPVSWLSTRCVEVVAGLGNPDALLEQVVARARQARWLAQRPDHTSYEPSALHAWLEQAAGRRADGIVTTMKDWVKLEPVLRRIGDRGMHDANATDDAGVARGAGAVAARLPFVVPRLEIEFIQGEHALMERLRSLASLD